MASLGVILLIILVAVVAPLVSAGTGHPANRQFRDTGLTADGQPLGPSRDFLLGTDALGRDILVRLAFGARISLFVAMVTTALAAASGAAVGLLAGYFGGLLDTVLARLVDLALAFPLVLLAISLASVVGPGIGPSIAVICIFSSAAMARVVRGQVLVLRTADFILAARSLGAGSLRVMTVHILPNVLTPVLVYAAMLIPGVLLAEASLSFLGLGAAVPTPTWGGMLNEALPYYRQAWWCLFFPGAALVTTTLAFSVLADRLADALDPRADLVFGTPGRTS